MRNRFFRAFCLAPDTGAGGAGSEGAGTERQPGGEGTQPTAVPQFDYDKLASLIAGKQSVTEESVLRGYFRQQNLSKEQVDQAIAAFKQQQAANTPDVAAIQAQLTQAQAATRQAQLQSAATMAAVGLGIDAKTIPYVIKMADLGQVTDKDGKINEEALKGALNKVLEDIPALKPQDQQAPGFQLGVPSGGQQSQNTTDAELDKIFGVKKG